MPWFLAVGSLATSFFTKWKTQQTGHNYTTPSPKTEVTTLYFHHTTSHVLRLRVQPNPTGMSYFIWTPPIFLSTTKTRLINTHWSTKLTTPSLLWKVSRRTLRVRRKQTLETNVERRRTTSHRKVSLFRILRVVAHGIEYWNGTCNYHAHVNYDVELRAQSH